MTADDALVTALTTFGLARVTLFGAAAVVHARAGRAGTSAPDAVRATVGVIIPAKDEAVGLERTVTSVLAAADRLPAVQIVVVDDGSTDGTAAIAAGLAERDARVRVLTFPRNRGKAAALNAGVAACDSGPGGADVIVTVDADTLLDPDALVNVTRPFADPGIAAVSGNVKVRDRQAWLGRLQSVEYVGALNVDRRGQATFGCISTIPGAFGAWRRSALAAGFSDRTLAEDTDATLVVGTGGGRIVYAADAVARTDTPDTLRGLVRQRIRWVQGNLECVGVHVPRLPSAVARYALLGLPDFAWRNLSGLAWLLVLLGTLPGVPVSPSALAYAIGSTLAVDLAIGVFAHGLDGERVPPVAIVAQRLVWIPLSYVVLARVLLRMISGRRGWT